MRGRGLAGGVASGRGGAVVPVADATTVSPLLSLLRAIVVAGRRRPRRVPPTTDQPVPEGSLTKAALVEQVAHVAGLTKKRAAIIVDTVFGNIAGGAATRGERSSSAASAVSVSGAASRAGAATPGPATAWTCRPRRVPYFKPGKELKELINRDPA